VELVGTIRNFDEGIRAQIHDEITLTAEKIAEANHATAEVNIRTWYPVTVNDPELTKRMKPSLEKVFGPGKVVDPGLITGAEDFSFFAREVPGMYFFMGVHNRGFFVVMDCSWRETAALHSKVSEMSS